MKLFRSSLAVLAGLMISISLFSTVSVSADENPPEYALGCLEDDASVIFEHLEACSATEEELEGLSSCVDLSSSFPAPGDQGDQRSCTAFAVAYAASSYLQNQEFNWGLSSNFTRFSPAYVYNQINGGQDHGSSITNAIQLIIDQGVCSLSDMPYNQDDYTTQPNSYQESKAENFKFDSYVIHEGKDSIKYDLANGNPVIISVSVYPDFDNISNSNMVYDVKSGTSRGRHALCLVGYDDNLQAFKFINSWGPNWGLSGYGYISYNLFGNSSVCGNRGYVISDSVQHFKSGVYGVEVNQNIGVYNNSALTNQTGTITTGSKVGITSIVAGSNGNPPVLKTRDGKYITALKSKVSKLNTFKVRYMANGGTGTMSDTIVPMGVLTNTSSISFAKTGYTFNGWYAKRNSDNKWLYRNTTTGTNAWYVEGTQPSNYVKYKYNNTQALANTSNVPNDIIYFYAQWSANHFTVVYNPNGGSGSMANTNMTYGVKQNLRANTFTKSGHSFKGWNVKRTSDNKWLYRNTSTGTNSWYVQGSQPSGYVKYLYLDQAPIAYTTPVNNDTATFYAQWN